MLKHLKSLSSPLMPPVITLAYVRKSSCLFWHPWWEAISLCFWCTGLWTTGEALQPLVSGLSPDPATPYCTWAFLPSASPRGRRAQVDWYGFWGAGWGLYSSYCWGRSLSCAWEPHDHGAGHCQESSLSSPVQPSSWKEEMHRTLRTLRILGSFVFYKATWWHLVSHQHSVVCATCSYHSQPQKMPEL